MKIATVISGFENEDVLPFTIQAPLLFSEKVVFVDGIRPIIKRCDPVVKWDECFDKPYSLDNTKSICEENSIAYINPERPLYNGEKINIGREYFHSHYIDFDILLYLESDEAIEPDDVPCLKENINRQIQFMSFDLIQLWKGYSGFRISPSCSKMLVNSHYVFSDADEGHNASDVLKEAFRNVIKDVRMYHLHMFREKALQRVTDGIWKGGGDGGGIDIEKVNFVLKPTRFLDKIYTALRIYDNKVEGCKNTYVGEVNSVE